MFGNVIISVILMILAILNGRIDRTKKHGTAF